MTTKITTAFLSSPVTKLWTTTAIATRLSSLAFHRVISPHSVSVSRHVPIHPPFITVPASSSSSSCFPVRAFGDSCSIGCKSMYDHHHDTDKSDNTSTKNHLLRHHQEPEIEHYQHQEQDHQHQQLHQEKEKPKSNLPISNLVPLTKVQSADLNPSSHPPVKVDVIAHRGASGSLPDHTLPSYRAAFLEGADWIELDVQCTSDGHLVINHDLDLSCSTDVSDWMWASFLKKRTRATPCLDGEKEVVNGWIVSDFTLEEIKRLRVKQRVETRSQDHNLLYEVPTLLETANYVQELVENERKKLQGSMVEMTKSQWLEDRNRFVLKFGRCRPNLKVGLYIETKRPTWYRSIGLPIEENLIQTIEQSNFDGRVIIQSFETESLSIIHDLKPEWDTIKLLTKHELDEVMKIESNNGDGGGGGGLYEYMKELKESIGCSGIGPDKQSIIPDPTMIPTTTTSTSTSSSTTTTTPSSFSSPIIQAAHDVGLVVHPYTFKSDVKHLHRIYGGNASQEFAQFFRLGVDGVFADFPDHGVFARELYNRLEIKGCGFLLYSDMFD